MPETGDILEDRMDDDPTPSWSDYDHLHMAAMADPVPYLRQLSDQCPVGRSEQHGGYFILTSHADCVAAARDPRLSSSPDRGPGPGFPYGDVHHSLLQMPMISDDGARHRDFRMQAQRIFSPKFARAQKQIIHDMCDELIDAFIESGEADLADQYSIELPAVLVAELLDLPHERRRDFQIWGSDLVATGNMDSLTKMIAFTGELHTLRQASPGHDIASQILGFVIDGRPITRDEWRGLVLLIILGGLDTTANAGGYAFEMIGRRPALREYMLGDLSRIPGTVQEFIRFISPVPQHSRGVTEDLEINGCAFRKGDVVQLNWLAANHDSEAFEEPDSFNPDRKIGHHLGFGQGAHLCLGRHLAVVELEVMLERVLARMPDYQIVEGGTQRFASLNRGMSRMRVTFTPGQKVSSGARTVGGRHHAHG